MKISILSMQRIHNYGSVLQAYALKKMLESLNHQVDFIDIIPGERIEQISDNSKIIKGENYYLKLKEKLYKINSMKKIKFYFLNKKLDKIFIKSQKELLNLDKNYKKIANDCQGVVIGSDEVFNISPSCSWGISTQLLGDINAPIVISYAASCGYTKFSDIPESFLISLKKALLNFKTISVRDKNTFNFVKQISGRESNYNLDPVLVYPFNEEIKGIVLNLKEPYMIVYAYKNRINDRNEIQAIKKYAQKNKLKIYCIGGEQDWCDEFPIWTPFEVLVGFKNANCIVTDTFHGSIIAAKYNKKFVTIIRESNKNKLIDLLERLNLEERILKNLENLEQCMDKNIEYQSFNELIEFERKRSIEYLFRNL